MASAHIAINGLSGRHNQQVRRLVDDIVSVRQRAEQMKAVFDQAALGSVVVELNGPFIEQMTGRVG